MDASTVRGAAAIGLTAAAACLPVLAVVVPLAVAPLFAVTALLGVVAAVTSDRARRLGHATLLFAIVAAWSFLSASWAIEPSATLRLAAVVTLTLTGGLSLLRVAATMTPVEKRRLEAALVAGVVVALGLLAVEAVGRTVSRISPQRWVLEAIGRRFDTTALNRGLAVIAILIWPVALILWRQVGRWAAPLPPLLLAA
ncbi:MAG: hypothetical protein FJX57_07130, partial [Alphaproteobacteria bacterium]|nr:hypothetical protein [Alphaproteobacteria bacterium]